MILYAAFRRDQGYRSTVTLAGLTPLTVLVGANGVGKSAVLADFYSLDPAAAVWCRAAQDCPGAGLADGVRVHAAVLAALADERPLCLLDDPDIHQDRHGLQAIAAACWRRVAADRQVILATHSLELIDWLIATTQDSRALLRVLRLFVDAADVRRGVVAIDGNRVFSRRLEFDDDLR